STGKTPVRRILPDGEGRIRVRVSDRPPTRLPAEGIPAGWTAKEFVGHASVELVRDDTRLALRLRSERSSFALYRDVVVDLNEFPFLSWSWKVVLRPPGAAGRPGRRHDRHQRHQGDRRGPDRRPDLRPDAR